MIDIRVMYRFRPWIGSVPTYRKMEITPNVRRRRISLVTSQVSPSSLAIMLHTDKQTPRSLESRRSSSPPRL
jgi:hypothetical protein